MPLYQNEDGIILNNSKFENLNNSIIIKNLLNIGLSKILSQNNDYINFLYNKSLNTIRYFNLEIFNTNKNIFEFCQLS